MLNNIDILNRVGIGESTIRKATRKYKSYGEMYVKHTALKNYVIQGENEVLKSTINNIIDYSNGKTVNTPIAESVNYRDLLEKNNIVTSSEKFLGLGRSKVYNLLGHDRATFRSRMNGSKGERRRFLSGSGNTDEFEGLTVRYGGQNEESDKIILTTGSVQRFSKRDEIKIGISEEEFLKIVDKAKIMRGNRVFKNGSHYEQMTDDGIFKTTFKFDKSRVLDTIVIELQWGKVRQLIQQADRFNQSMSTAANIAYIMR